MSQTLDPKERARAYMASVLDDPDARPADKLRAAEAILRGDLQPAKGTRDAVRMMSDAELEAAARGEGGAPPKGGPKAETPKTGPIRADGNPIARSQEVGAAENRRPRGRPPGKSGKGGPKAGPSASESRPGAVISSPKAPISGSLAKTPAIGHNEIDAGAAISEDHDPLS